MKKLSLLCGVFLFPFITHAQTEQSVKSEIIKLDSIVVQAYRAGINTPVAYSRVSAKQIRDISPTVSIPMLMNTQPSVVSTTEGGSGLGYSYMRVRGSDGSRINVTINGIALNDAESQEVFWVDLPALTSFIDNIQLQRGVGTSVNGAGAFGASINIQTLSTAQNPYGIADFAFGSWNSFVTTIGGGTGLSKKGFTFDIRYSNSHGNGYIRNSGGDLNSIFAKLGYYNGKDLITFNYLYGYEKTGITWNGIPKYMLESDRRYNSAGEYYDSLGNRYYYDNETDNYFQNHLQGVYQHSYSQRLNLSFAVNYTNGYGYYENYKSDKKFSKYGLSSQILDGVTYLKSDFITRELLDNNYLAANLTLNYFSERTTLISGISKSYYKGAHFGRVFWSKYNENIMSDLEWYRNYGDKSDFTIFSKWEQKYGAKLHSYLDLQVRSIKYEIEGSDDDFVNLNYSKSYTFFNPKAGVTWNFNKLNALYFSVAIGHKEPSRADLKEAIKALQSNKIKRERLVDFEFGYRYARSNFAAGINIYSMKYMDQLVPTGKLSETGYVIKENVKNSYRRGAEVEFSYSFSRLLNISGNFTLSRNKILNYVSWVDIYDNPINWTYITQISETIKKTNLAYSPEVVSYLALTIKPADEYEFTVNSKVVGKQYYDNSSNEIFSIPSYNTLNVVLKRSFMFNGSSKADISFYINNLFNSMYFSNAWVYTARFADGSDNYVEDGVYPQPGTNFTVKLALKF